MTQHCGPWWRIRSVKSKTCIAVCRTDDGRKYAVNIDIERQLTGGAVSDEPACEVLRKEFTMPPEQILLVETCFTWPTIDSLEDE